VNNAHSLEELQESIKHAAIPLLQFRRVLETYFLRCVAMLRSRGSSFRCSSIKEGKLNYAGKVDRELSATAAGQLQEPV
jgi:hypothetical protein